MRNVPPLSGPGAVFCLVGSSLALVAYFLPYSGFPVESLWNQLLLLGHLSLGGQDELLSLLLLPLLPSITMVGCWGVFVRSPRWNLVALYLVLTILSLIGSVGMTLIAIFNSYISYQCRYQLSVQN